MEEVSVTLENNGKVTAVTTFGTPPEDSVQFLCKNPEDVISYPLSVLSVVDGFLILDEEKLLQETKSSQKAEAIEKFKGEAQFLTYGDETFDINLYGDSELSSQLKTIKKGLLQNVTLISVEGGFQTFDEKGLEDFIDRIVIFKEQKILELKMKLDEIDRATSL